MLGDQYRLRCKRDRTEPPAVSVVVPAHNAARVLPRCLTALKAQAYPPDAFEIIVVDDGSADESQVLTRKTIVEWARQGHNPELRLVRQEWRGSAVVRNRGVAEAHGRVVMFTDVDCEPVPGWIRAMLAPLADPGIAAVAGGYLTRPTSVVARLARAEFEERYRLLGSQSTVDAAFTHSAAFRREVLLDAGGFDERMLNIAEDRELSYRLAASGCQIAFAPSGLVFHRHPASLSDYLRKKFGRGLWVTLVVKRYPGKFEAGPRHRQQRRGGAGRTLQNQEDLSQQSPIEPTCHAHRARFFLIVRNREASMRVFDKYGVNGNVIELDLERFENAALALERIQPDITFNLAGYGVDRGEREKHLAYRLNGHLVGSLCDVLAAMPPSHWRGQRIVHTGSAVEYGNVSGVLSEASPQSPCTLYGRSKAFGTSLFTERCERFELQGVTARLFTLYGQGEHGGRLLPSLMDAARTGEPVRLTDGLQRRDFTFVEDVAEGLLRLGLANPARLGTAVNLSSGRLTTVRTFVDIAARVAGIPSAALHFGAIPVHRGEETSFSAIRIDNLACLTGWVPQTSVEAGIRRTLNFAT